MSTENKDEQPIELKENLLTEGYNSPGRGITKNVSSASLGSIEKQDTKPSKSPRIIKKVGKYIDNMMDKIDSKFIEKANKTLKNDDS